MKTFAFKNLPDDSAVKDQARRDAQARAWLAIALGDQPEFETLPGDVIRMLYENVYLYGPNGENVALMAETLNSLVTKLSEEEFEETYMTALRLLLKEEKTFDSLMVSPNVRHNVAALARSLDEFPIEFPLFCLGYVALQGLSFGGQAQMIVLEETAGTMDRLCELLGVKREMFALQLSEGITK